MLKKPPIEELCQNEIHDAILDILEEARKNIPENVYNRKRDILDAILASNKSTGEREKLKKELCSIVNDISFSNTQTNRLSRIGFRIIKGKGHYKLCWKEGSPYRVVFSATPSDWRFSQKTKTDISRMFF